MQPTAPPTCLTESGSFVSCLTPSRLGSSGLLGRFDSAEMTPGQEARQRAGSEEACSTPLPVQQQHKR